MDRHLDEDLDHRPEPGAVLFQTAEPPSDPAYPEFPEVKTDAGNVNTFSRLTRGSVRWVVEFHRWMIWNGRTWTVDDYGHLVHVEALKVGRHLGQRAVAAERKAAGPALNEQERQQLVQQAKALARWAMRAHNCAPLNAIQSRAKKDPRIAVSIDQLDADWERHGPTDPRTDALRVAIHESFAPRNRGHRLHRVLNPYQLGA
jgi:hypothetical protein